MRDESGDLVACYEEGADEGGVKGVRTFLKEGDEGYGEAEEEGERYDVERGGGEGQEERDGAEGEGPCASVAEDEEGGYGGADAEGDVGGVGDEGDGIEIWIRDVELVVEEFIDCVDAEEEA